MPQKKTKAQRWRNAETRWDEVTAKEGMAGGWNAVDSNKESGGGRTGGFGPPRVDGEMRMVAAPVESVKFSRSGRNER
jgi:hypothetical protein